MMTPTTGTMGGMTPGTEGMRGPDLMKRFDRNGDGKIDDDERADAKDAMLKEQVDRQMARITAGQATPEQLRLRALEFFDADRDGRLNDEERAAMQKFVETRVTPGIPAERTAWREEFLKRVDKNVNGRLDSDELAGVREYLDQVRPESPTNTPGDANVEPLQQVLRAAIEANPEQRQRFDLNGDLRINDREWEEARRRIAHGLMGGANNVTPVDPARLDAVAAEVARRREVREKAMQQLEAKK